MNWNPLPGARGLALGLALLAPAAPSPASEATLTRTNWSERWITNVIEVTVPTNRFVDQYQTNWVRQWRTNLVDVYATNWIMVTATNPVTIEALWTNLVTAYRTNVTTRTRTNTVAVAQVQTNVVTRYHTNWTTLNFTNWVTLVQLKTNWVTQPVTNVVQIEMPKPSSPAAAPASEALAKPDPAPATAAASRAVPVALAAARTTRPPANNLVEVRMTAHWASQSAAPLQVQSWRIQGEDGAVFLFGQEKEFVRQLPVGTYTVEARLRMDKDSPLMIVRGTLVVTLQDAVVHQRLLATN
jgi:hypothetical protein